MVGNFSSMWKLRVEKRSSEEANNSEGLAYLFSPSWNSRKG
jgi:hypothetical protein